MGLKILLVDDDLNSRKLLGALLEMEGHPVDVCDGSACALQRLSGQLYDFLLTDYVMPEMSGLELTRLARQLQPEIRCCVISGQPQPLDHGLSDITWISKPVDMDVLLTALQ
jgi:CheY-like chemotaxis protein